MPSIPSAILCEFADSFANLLFEGELKDRLAHHFAHVAPESWLAQEAALLFNICCSEWGLDGWSAILENKKVDLTLIPPNHIATSDSLSNAVFIELKLVGTDWWKTAWPDVASDLAGKPKKPKAHLALCLLFNYQSQTCPNRRQRTDDLYSEYWDSVPTTPQVFSPAKIEHSFHLLHTSDEYTVSWPQAVFGRLPHGLWASMRLLWLAASG